MMLSLWIRLSNNVFDIMGTVDNIIMIPCLISLS